MHSSTFCIGNLTTLVSGLNRASDIIVAQENKQTRHANNPCAIKCNDPNALCLLTSSTSRVCSCTMEMTVGTAVGSNVTCQPPVCGLDCNMGKCILNEKGVATCKCPSLYEGERCERYRCSGYCQNKGACYAGDMIHIIYVPAYFKKFNNTCAHNISFKSKPFVKSVT